MNRKKRRAVLRHAGYYLRVCSQSEELLFAKNNVGPFQSLESLQRDLPQVFQSFNCISAEADQDEEFLRLALAYAVAMDEVLPVVLTPSQEVEWLSLAVKAAQHFEERDLLCGLLANCGRAQRRNGNVVESERLLEEGLKLVRELSDQRLEARILNELGLLYLHTGESKKAIARLELAFALSRRLPTGGDNQELTTLVSCLGTIAQQYSRQGKHRRAIKVAKKTLRLAKKTGDKINLAVARSLLGSVYVQGFTLSGRRSLPKHLISIAFFHMRIGSLYRATRLLKNALVLARLLGVKEIESHCLAELGIISLLLMHNEQSISYLLKALGMTVDPTHEVVIRSQLGVAYNTIGQYAKAVEVQQRCLELSRTRGDRHGEACALHNLSQAYKNLGDEVIADSCAGAALEIFLEIGSPIAGKTKELLKK